MRIKVEVSCLDQTQWKCLDHWAFTSYFNPARDPIVHATFRLTDLHERHIEIPVSQFADLVIALDRVVGKSPGEATIQEVAEAALTPDALPDYVRGDGSRANMVRGT